MWCFREHWFCCLFFTLYRSFFADFIAIKPWNKEAVNKFFFFILLPPSIRVWLTKISLSERVWTNWSYWKKLTSSCEIWYLLFKNQVLTKKWFDALKIFLILVREPFKITINNSLRQRRSNQTKTDRQNNKIENKLIILLKKVKKIVLKKWETIDISSIDLRWSLTTKRRGRRMTKQILQKSNSGNKMKLPKKHFVLQNKITVETKKKRNS